MSEDTDAFCPYKGLRPYEETDLPYFFGRDADSQIVAGSVLARRLTILFGGSGVGKTSILRAAAMPEIRRSTGRQPIYFNTWQSADFLDRLHAAVAVAFGEQAEAIPPAADLAAQAEAWTATAGAAAATHGRSRRPAPLVLVFDQFEEFFLYLQGPRDSFAAELAALVNRRELDARVVICLRNDRLAYLDRLSARIPDILTNRVELAALDHPGAIAACRTPVERYSRDDNPDRGAGPAVTIRTDLVEALLRSALLREPLAEGEPVPAELVAGRFDTAYLQLALTKVWERERSAGSTELRGQTFKDLGGGAGIASAHLEDELRRLSANELFLCGRFFDRLVTSGGSKIAQPYEALRDAALPKPDTAKSSPPKQLYQAFKQRLLGILVGIRAKSPPESDRPSPLPLPGMDEATAERFGQLAAGATPADVLRELLDGKLAHASRFVLRTVPSPVRGGDRAYEIFHDVLAAPIRRWTDRFRQSCQVVEGYWRIALSLAIATLFAALMVLAISLWLSAREASAEAERRANQATAALEWSRLESNGSYLTPIEIDALWNIARFTPAERSAFAAQLPGNAAHVLKFAFHQGELSRALGIGYGRDHADFLVPPLVDAIKTTANSDQLRALTQAVQALAPRLDPAQADFGPARAALASSITAAEAAAWAGAIGEVLAKLPAETELPEIVELLKFPTAGQRDANADGEGNPTRVLLAALAKRYPEVPALQTGSLDDALAWVAKTYPRIDLDSPPVRPPPLRPSGPETD
ncbi:MAG: hypothetical protein WAS21_27205 [Geminicoccaceae bacterium]